MTGTINLHEATNHLPIPLDFFIMTSSISTQIAQPTQAAYCAANSFQDYFARYRRQLGLPATAIAFGLIREVGELGRRIDVQSSMSRLDLYGTGEYEFLQLLEAAFLPGSEGDIRKKKQKQTEWFDELSEAQVIASLEPAKLLDKQEENRQKGVETQPRWHRDPRFSHIIREMQNIASDSDRKKASFATIKASSHQSHALMLELESHIQAKDIGKAKQTVTIEIVNRVADILFVPAESVQPSQSVASHGVDSLVAAELRNWFLVKFRFQVSFLKLLDLETSIVELADLVVEDCVRKSSE